MVTKEQIDRINVLAKKKKTEGLTEAEQAEQKVLLSCPASAILLCYWQIHDIDMDHFRNLPFFTLKLISKKIPTSDCNALFSIYQFVFR